MKLNEEDLVIAIAEGQKIIATCQCKICKDLLRGLDIPGSVAFSNEKRQLIVRVAKEHGSLAHKVVSTLILPDPTTIVVEENTCQDT